MTRADPHIGLLHRATEKLIEYKSYLQVRTLELKGLANLIKNKLKLLMTSNADWYV